MPAILSARIIERPAGADSIEARRDLVHEDVEQDRALRRSLLVDRLFASPCRAAMPSIVSGAYPCYWQSHRRFQDCCLRTGAATLRIRGALRPGPRLQRRTVSSRSLTGD